MTVAVSGTAALILIALANGGEQCQCVGGKGYGGECAHWDAPDEKAWCRVRRADSCGFEDTFESSGRPGWGITRTFWAHRPCGGKGLPYNPKRLHLPAKREPASKATTAVTTMTTGIVRPHVVMRRPVKVYSLCKLPCNDQRERKILVEGLQSHPFVTIVQSVQEADFVLFLTVQDAKADEQFLQSAEHGWKSKAFLDDHGNSTVSRKLVVVDYADTPISSPLINDRTDRRPCCKKRGDDYWEPPLAYFKRAWIAKFNGTLWLNPMRYETSMKHVFGYTEKSLQMEPHAKVPVRYHSFYKRNHFWPISYAVLDHLAKPLNVKPRTIDVLCTLRTAGGDRVRNPPHYEVNRVRRRVERWLLQAQEMWPSYVFRIGPVSAHRHKSSEYFNTICNAKIVVTADPAYYEGDHRLWEALAGGGLVMTNDMWTPVPHMPLQGKQIVYFDTHDKDAFLRKLKYYLEHQDEAAAIGKAGYKNAMKHHRSVNRVDYLLGAAIDASKVGNPTSGWALDDMHSTCTWLESKSLLATGANASRVCEQWLVHYGVATVDQLRDAFENRIVWLAFRRYVSLKPEAWVPLAHEIFKQVDGRLHGGTLPLRLDFANLAAAAAI